MKLYLAVGTAIKQSASRSGDIDNNVQILTGLYCRNTEEEARKAHFVYLNERFPVHDGYMEHTVSVEHIPDSELTKIYIKVILEDYEEE